MDIEPFLLNTNNMDRVNYIVEKIKASRPDLKEIKVYPLTPVVGAHAGPGTVGVGYIKK